MTKCPRPTHRSVWRLGSLRTQLIALSLTEADFLRFFTPFPLCQCGAAGVLCIFRDVSSDSPAQQLCLHRCPWHTGLETEIVLAKLPCPVWSRQPCFLTASSKAPSTAARRKRLPQCRPETWPSPHAEVPSPLSPVSAFASWTFTQGQPLCGPCRGSPAWASLPPLVSVPSTALEKPAFIVSLPCLLQEGKSF